MIREYQESDQDIVVNIWLEASVKAHHFLPRAYWESKAEDMRNIYIPAAKTYVYMEDLSSQVLGFISLVDNYIAAVFVLPECQGQGIGKQLIDDAKERYDRLELGVYVENIDATAFYKKQGFVIVDERMEEHTGYNEYIMVYERNGWINNQ